MYGVSVGIVNIVIAVVEVTIRPHVPRTDAERVQRDQAPVGIVGYDIMVVVVDVARRQHVACTIGTNRDRRSSRP